MGKIKELLLGVSFVKNSIASKCYSIISDRNVPSKYLFGFD